MVVDPPCRRRRRSIGGHSRACDASHFGAANGSRINSQVQSVGQSFGRRRRLKDRSDLSCLGERRLVSFGSWPLAALRPCCPSNHRMGTVRRPPDHRVFVGAVQRYAHGLLSQVFAEICRSPGRGAMPVAGPTPRAQHACGEFPEPLNSAPRHCRGRISQDERH
jgi:hypothetical protein